jgi:hypothetical protein
MPQRTLTDVPHADLAFQQSLLESEGFTVEVRDQGNGLFTLVGTTDGEPAGRAPGTGKDGDHIAALVTNGGSAAEIARAQQTAKAALPSFPHNGCAANLSALLQQSGMAVRMTLGAGALAHLLETRGWSRIAVGDQAPGDVGVTLDNTDPPGADHLYLVVETIDSDEMVIADNQAETTHRRCASGRRASGEARGTTRTEYFLRAPR